jgi:hypothetical protein
MSTFLTPEAREELILKVAAQFDVTVVPNRLERIAAAWLVNKILPCVPEWVAAFMLSVADGLTVEELETHLEVITSEVHKLVDRAWIPDAIEKSLIRPVIRHLLEYALVGHNMPGV